MYNINIRNEDGDYGSESAFSIGAQFLNPHLSKLNEDTVEALMCSQDWLRNEIEGNKFNFTCKFFF